MLPCLSDEDKIVPTQIPSLYAFLTLAPSLDVHSAACYLNFYAFYETPGCTWRLIHVDKCFVCLNQSSVLSLKMTKNLQSRHSSKKNVPIFGMLESRLNFNPYRIFEYSPIIEWCSRLTSENYRVREPSDVPSQLSIDHEFKHDMCISQPFSSKLNHLYPQCQQISLLYWDAQYSWSYHELTKSAKLSWSSMD